MELHDWLKMLNEFVLRPARRRLKKFEREGSLWERRKRVITDGEIFLDLWNGLLKYSSGGFSSAAYQMINSFSVENEPLPAHSLGRLCHCFFAPITKCRALTIAGR